MKEYRFKINGRDYKVAVNGIQDDVADVIVNGVQYKVELENMDAPATLRNTPSSDAESGTVSKGQPAVAAKSAQTVTSPLPGVIIEISVKEGQAVKAGQKIAVLEAMKMENEIRAYADGTVTEICVQRGDSVLEGAKIAIIA